MRGRLVGALVAVLGIAPPAAAQTELVGGFDLDLLRPAPGSSSLIVAERPRTPAASSYSFGFVGSYMSDPLVACTDQAAMCGDAEYGAVISDRVTGWLTGSYSFGIAEVGVALPITLVNGTDLESPPGMDLGSFGLGDLRATGKFPLTRRGEAFGFGLLASLSFPTGRSDDFLGGPGAGLEAWALADYEMGPVAIAASGGFRFRTSDDTLENVELGHAALLAGGASVDILKHKLAFVLDVHGAIAVSGRDASPFETVGALRYKAAPSWMVTAGGGAGLGGDAGAPAWRAFAGLTYRHERPDTDGDGIIDDDDRCPLVPEDFDNFEDTDGCPDLDNDGDKIVDADDGCDNDPEDRDEFQDEDGCPDLDNDKDALLDDVDKCPNDPEDPDGFEDQDGCPDTDNDQDGLADTIDKCPNEPEVVNLYQDDDGCPDEKLVVVTSTRFELKQTVHFEYNTAEIKTDSFQLLAEVAKALNDNPQIKKVRIEGHTDDVGGDDFNLKLSLRRAESVKAHLVEKHGVDGARLVTEGFGKTRPIQAGADDAARAANRRVEFVIVETEGQP